MGVMSECRLSLQHKHYKWDWKWVTCKC